MTEEHSDVASLRQQIDTILTLAKGEQVNVCYAILKIIERAPADNQAEVLRHAAESFGSSESSEEIPIDAYITKDELEKLNERYAKLVNDMLAVLLDENPGEDEFYVQLWALVRNPILRDEKARAFALFWLLIDKRLPYFHLLEGMRMANEDYGVANRRLRTARAKIRFILAREFDQKTQQADLVLKVIDAAAGSDRILLMGEVIFQLKSSTEKILSYFRNLAE